ncbi:ribosomal protein L10 [Acrasis kona]|uniref:Ribosomal protein n=1 Tax=Acrasis kona TaxID=1008807 RepID=A0AAW2Z4N0_9EUKA
MTKLSGDELRSAIDKILKEKENRNFQQTVDLQIKLKNYDPAKDKRFSGTVKLPNETKSNFKVCVLGNHSHCEKAKALGLAFKTVDDLKNMNKDKKLVRKLANSFHAFLASEDLIVKIPRILGPGLSKAGKFPISLGANEDIPKKVDELRKTIKFQLKKEINLALGIGHLNLTEDQLVGNITMALNFLVSLLKKHWQNVGSVTIKATMGKPHNIYP